MSVTILPHQKDSKWNQRIANIWDWAKANRFILITMIISSFLLFANLGNSYPPIDEANTMIISKNVLRFGYPAMWDGEYLIPPFFEADMTKDMVWVSHPWLQFYITAASFAILGLNTLAARIPFALAGLLSVLFIFPLTERMSGSKQVAQLATVMLALHTGFLVYSRQSRYYSLIILFTILTVLTFLRWLDKPKIWNLFFFIISSALLFHAYYPFWVFLMLTIGLYFLFIERRWRLLPAFIIGCVFILLLTAPWLAYASPHAPVETGPELDTLVSNFLTYLWKLDTWIAPLLTLTLILVVLVLLRTLKVIRKDESLGLRPSKTYLLFISVLLYTAFISVIPILTTQYAMPAIPFFVILAAFLVWKIREHSRWVAAIVLVLLFTTNILNIFPHIIVEKSGVNPASVEGVVKNPRCDFITGPSLEHYLKDEMVIRSYFFDFLSSLFLDYDNRIEGIITYLNQHASKDETVLASWGDANAIRFYTNMKVVYNFFPLYGNEEVMSLVYRPDNQPDWIVPDTYKFYLGDNSYFTYDLQDYEKMRVLYPKEFFDNAPNLDETEFRTNPDAPQYFYLLRRKANLP